MKNEAPIRVAVYREKHGLTKGYMCAVRKAMGLPPRRRFLLESEVNKYRREHPDFSESDVYPKRHLHMNDSILSHAWYCPKCHCELYAIEKPGFIATDAAGAWVCPNDATPLLRQTPAYRTERLELLDKLQAEVDRLRPAFRRCWDALQAIQSDPHVTCLTNPTCGGVAHGALVSAPMRAMVENLPEKE